MDFEPSDRCKELLERVRAFMDEHVYPVEDEVDEALDREVDADTPFPPILVELRARAKAEGLWNLFLPSSTTTARASPTSSTGRSARRWAAHARRRRTCSTASRPTRGNMEILVEHATPRAARALARAAARGRDPQLLLDDRARHRGLGPDRPRVPRRARRRRVGDQRPQVVDDATRSAPQVAIVMAVTDPDAARAPAGDDAARPDRHARLQPGPPAVQHGPRRRARPLGDRLRGLPRPGRRGHARRAPAAASRSPRTGSARAASTTACG